MHRVYRLIMLAITLSILLGTSYAQAPDYGFIDLKQVPLDGSSAQDFVPHGWKIKEQIDGDLNGDSKSDLVLTLIEDIPDENNSDREPALVILLKTENGKWHRAGAADRLLCRQCEPKELLKVSVKIEGGVIVVVDQGIEMIQRDILTNRTLRFRYDPGLQRFVLIAKDVENYDTDYEDDAKAKTSDTSAAPAVNPCSMTANVDYLTGTETLTKRDGKAAPFSVKKGPVSISKKFIEDAEYWEHGDEEFESPPTDQKTVPVDGKGDQGRGAAPKGNYQNICGWVDNPTPSNWSITDRTGEWEIGAQGAYQAKGVDMPDFGGMPDHPKFWVETNGSYGFGCACIKAKVDSRNRRIRSLVHVRALPIKTCREDSTLSQRNRPEEEVIGGCRLYQY